MGELSLTVRKFQGYLQEASEFVYVAWFSNCLGEIANKF